MPEPCVFAGVDVSKAKLDLAVRTGKKQFAEFSFANSKAGIRRLVNTVTQAGLSCRVVLEPTSRFHVQLLLALAAAPRCQVMPVNPRQARKFQQGQGDRAKTDSLDARNLASMACQLDGAGEFIPFISPSDELRELQLLGRHVAVCVEARAKAKCRISSYPAEDAISASLVASNRRSVAFHQAEIDHLIDQMLQIAMADEFLKLVYGLLLQIRGIGKQSALQLMGELLVLPPGMGPRQWVACAGLDPQPQQSGTSNPPARISRMGNRYLKQALYMAAMTTTQFEPQIKAYYEQFHARKQSKRLAQVVVMRRLLHGIWHMLQLRTPLDPAKCFAVPHS